MTIQLTNPNDRMIAGTQWSDVFPPGIAVSVDEGIVSNTCGGDLVALPGDDGAVLTSGSIAPYSSCAVVVNTVGTNAFTVENHSGTVASANASDGLDATGSLTITSGTLLSAPVVTTAFTPVSVEEGGTSQLTISLTNGNDDDVRDVSFTDIYPVGLVNATNAILSECGGTVTAASQSGFMHLVGGTVPLHGGCTVVLNVVATRAGTFQNATGAIFSSNAATATPASYTLNVLSGVIKLAAPVVAAEFAPDTVSAGATTEFRVTLANPAANTAAITGVSMQVLYPNGNLTNAATGAVVENTCGGRLTAIPGGEALYLENGVIPEGGECAVAVRAVPLIAGALVASTGIVSSINADDGVASTAQLTMMPAALLSPPASTLAFDQSSIEVNAPAVMTVTLSNEDSQPITDMEFNAEYPIGIRNSDSGAILDNTCGGTATAQDFGTTLAFLGGAIAPHGSCTIAVRVIGTEPGNVLAQTGAIFSSNATTGGSALAQITVTSPVQPTPIVTCTPERQIYVVGDVIALDLATLFAPPAGDTLGFSVAGVPASLSLTGSVLGGTLNAADVPGSPYDSFLTAVAFPGNGQATLPLRFDVLAADDPLLHDGFDGAESACP